MSIFYLDNENKKQFNNLAYKNILKSSPNAIIIIDMQGSIIFVSKRALDFFGFKDQSSLYGKDILSIIPDQEKEHAKKIINDVIKSGLVENDIFIFFDKQQNTIYAEVNAAIIKDDEGKPEAILFTARNITDKILKEKKLLFFEHVVENSLSMIFWFDEKGNIKYANKTATTLLGYNKEELLQKKLFQIDPTISFDRWSEFIFDLKINNYDFFESKILTREGFSFPVESTYYYFNFEGNELFCAFLKNISDRKKYEHDLKESERFYKSIIEQSLAGVILVDADSYSIISSNQAFCNILDYTKEEIKEKKLCDIIITINKEEECNSNLNTNFIPNGEYSCRKKDDTIVFLFLNSNIISFHNKNLISIIVIDITKIKLMEKALKESEEKFKLFADYTYDWEYWIGENNKLIYISPSCERITGYTTQEFLHDNELLQKIIHPKSLALFNKHCEDEKKGTKSFNLSFKIITKFGDIRWINHVCQPVYSKDGTYHGRRVSNRDFTERKIAEDLLVESESRYRTLIENQSDLICQHDENGTIYYVNEAFCKLFKKNYDDLIGTNSLIFLQNKTREIAKLIFHKIKESKIPDIFESQIFLENGEMKWIHWTIQPIFDSKDEFIELLSVGRDITERKLAEEALENEKQRLRVTLRSIGDSVITLDTEGKIQLMSRAAEELFESSINELMNKYFSNVFQAYYYNNGNIFDENFYFEVIDGGNTYETKEPLLFKTKSGKEVIINFSASPIRDKYFNIYGIVVVLKDITEGIKNVDMMIKTQKLESIGNLAAGIAHEFNNILTAILGNISLTKIFLKNSDSKILQRLEEAEKASLRAKDVAQQLITFAKGGAPIKTHFSIDEVLKDICSYVFSNTNIKINYYFDNNIPQIFADINQIRQMLNNILTNSLEAMPDGGNLSIKVFLITPNNDRELSKVESKQFIFIEIKDTGYGINQDIISKVFDPYFTTKPTGRGLGLTTAYYIAQRHNGSLSISSAPNQGTIVTINLPVK